jgi:hypothetical protein
MVYKKRLWNSGLGTVVKEQWFWKGGLGTVVK